MDVESIKSIGKCVTDLISNKNIQSFICGTYSDGKPRNIIDAVNGEYYSSRQKKKATSKKHMKKKTKFKL